MKTVDSILMSKEAGVISISPDASVFSAIELMSEKNVGALPVMDGERLVGILSERDYARKAILLGRSSEKATVREIMTENVITVGPDTTEEECMRLMTEKRLRHLPVRDGERVAGMVSIGDVVKAIISEQNATIRNLHTIINDLMSDRNLRNLVIREMDKA